MKTLSWQGLARRKVVVAAVVGLFAALIAPAALAARPTIQRIPVESHYVDSSCGFPVRLDATGTVVDISYTDALGNFHDFQAAPQIKQTMTNLVTGKTSVITVSGPGTGTFNADGSFTIVGSGLWGWAPGGFFNPLPYGLFLTKGRFVYSVSASGVARFTSTGTTIDLCAELA